MSTHVRVIAAKRRSLYGMAEDQSDSRDRRHPRCFRIPKPDVASTRHSDHRGLHAPTRRVSDQVSIMAGGFIETIGVVNNDRIAVTRMVSTLRVSIEVMFWLHCRFRARCPTASRELTMMTRRPIPAT